MNICICIAESLCCTPEINTTLQINCTPIKMFKKEIQLNQKWLPNYEQYLQNHNNDFITNLYQNYKNLPRVWSNQRLCSREDMVAGCAENWNLTSRVGSKKIMCRQRKQTCGRQAGASYERDGWESAIHRCKLLYIERINNKVQLYSTGSYIQYAMINYNGKEYFLKCIWITGPLCYTVEINIANQLVFFFFLI